MDDHEGHWGDLVEQVGLELNIRPYAIPANKTYLLQYADVFYFAPFKRQWANALAVLREQQGENVWTQMSALRRRSLVADTAQNLIYGTSVIYLEMFHVNQMKCLIILQHHVIVQKLYLRLLLIHVHV